MSDWKRVSASGDRGEKFKFEEKGDTLQGIYLGSHTVPMNDGKDVPAFNIKSEDNTIYSPLGSKDLADKMGKVPVGAEVRIVYEGKKKLGGGKTLKVFTVDHRSAE